MPDAMHNPFMDTITGFVTDVDSSRGVFTMVTADGRRFEVGLTGDPSAELLRNLDEPYADATGHVAGLLEPGRHVIAYGVFYPENDKLTYEAKRLVFLGRDVGE